jgi:hypothetical protein
VLEECPFNSDHRAPDSAIFEHANGSLGFKCLHASCADKHWRDVRELFEGPRQQWRPDNEAGRHQARAETTDTWPKPG